MVLAAPELVIAEIVELLDEIEVAAELQQRVLAEGMMRGEEGSEFQTRHDVSRSDVAVFVCDIGKPGGQTFQCASGPVLTFASLSVGGRRSGNAFFPGSRKVCTRRSQHGFTETRVLAYLRGNRGDDRDV